MARTARKASGKPGKSSPVRFAVVGVGYFAQIAALPGFRHAGSARLTALVSGDPVKRKMVAEKYGVPHVFGYAEYDACLEIVDAVYIALPNDLHCAYAVRALRKGVHVLCEKPMALTEDECRKMIRAAEAGGARLMIAYRLHMNAANLRAIELIRNGKIGKPRVFNSVFTMQVSPGNIRVQARHGGGTLYDIGVYCINAARYLFGGEPVEVSAFSAASSDRRFREVDEMTSAVLRFPGDRLASFTVSFGAADAGDYLVVGTEGTLRLEKAYEYAEGQTLTLDTGGKKPMKWKFPRTDQLGGEIQYFAQCLLQGRKPEPSGLEGLADVRIVRALYKSARTGKTVRLRPFPADKRPVRAQQRKMPPVRKPQLVRAKPASRD
jgi:predicted dehydrogenase